MDKLIPLDAAAKAAAKKRPKAPDLADENDAKKQKKAAAKNKAKAKPKAKTKPESVTSENRESIVGLQSDVGFTEFFGSGEVASSRPRKWLDDLVACLEKAYGRPLEKLDNAYNSTSKMGAVGTLLSMGLEFGLTGKLLVEKKSYKDWSKAHTRWYQFYSLNSRLRTGLRTQVSICQCHQSMSLSFIITGLDWTRLD